MKGCGVCLIALTNPLNEESPSLVVLACLCDGGEFAIVHSKNFTALDDDDLSVILCDHVILVG